MMKNLPTFLDKLSDFFAQRKGLLIMLGLIFIIANLLISVFSDGWLARTNFLLQFGMILSLIGILLSWAL
jgi:hypothetical protein